MIYLVAFDCNGTLISDTLASLDADNHILKMFGGRPVDLKTYRKTMTIPVIDFYVKHGCDREELLAKSEEVSEVFHTFYDERASKCKTRGGARELLKWLKNKSIDSIILSNHTVEGIELQLERLKIKDYFSGILANTELSNAITEKNKLVKLKEYLSAYNYKPKEVVIVGDSPEEVEIGKELGLITVAITSGFYSNSRLRQSRPRHTISNLLQLKQVILSYKYPRI